MVSCMKMEGAALDFSAENWDEGDTTYTWTAIIRVNNIPYPGRAGRRSLPLYL